MDGRYPAGSVVPEPKSSSIGFSACLVSTDGCGGQFQGEPDYGPVVRGATGASAVRRRNITDEKDHGRNVSDPLGGQFKRILTRPSRRTMGSSRELATASFTWHSTTLDLPRMIKRNRRRGPPTQSIRVLLAEGADKDDEAQRASSGGPTPFCTQKIHERPPAAACSDGLQRRPAATACGRLRRRPASTVSSRSAQTFTHYCYALA